MLPARLLVAPDFRPPKMLVLPLPMVKLPAADTVWKAADTISVIAVLVTLVTFVLTQCTANKHMEINLGRDWPGITLRC